MYPLGSCTMKYNPKINEVVARLPGFADIHPYQDPSTVQGALELMWELQEMLGEISGFHEVACSRPPARTGNSPAASSSAPGTRRTWRHRPHQDPGAGHRPRHQPGHRRHGGLPGRHHPVGCSRQLRSGGAARRRRPGHRRPDDHEPEHARPLGRAHPGDRRRRSRGGRPGLQRWRQLQRHPRYRPPR